MNNKTSSQFIVLSALLEQYGVKAEIVGTGTLSAAMTQVMTGQIDVGTDGNGLLGVPEFAKGEVRPIGYGRELESMRGVTVRGLAVSEGALRDRREVIARFLQAYQETVDWMYRDPKAVEWFAEEAQSSLDEARRVKTDMYPEGAMKVGEVAGVDFSVKQGLAFNRTRSRADRRGARQDVRGGLDADDVRRRQPPWEGYRVAALLDSARP